MKRLVLACVLASCSRHAAPGPERVAFVDVTVVPMDREQELAHQTVIVQGDRIVELGPSTSVNVDGARAIDARGKWLIPGLADMHVHYNEESFAALFVANGVTFVRNMGGAPQMIALRERTRRGELLGPLMITAGPITDGMPPFWPESDIAANPEDAERLVAAQQAAGYDFVKVYSGLSRESYAAIVAAANKHGMRFAGHAPIAVTLSDLAAAHQRSMEHMYGWLEAAVKEPPPGKLAWPERMKWALGAFDESKLASLAKQLRDGGVWNCPTLIVNDRYAHLDDVSAYKADPVQRYTAPASLAAFEQMSAALVRPADQLDNERRVYKVDERAVKALADAGAGILAGTDLGNPYIVAGFSLHEELARLVAAGLSPFQALTAATAEPARFLEQEAEFGTIARGRRADLVLLDADPLASIANTTKIAGVMLRGRWISRGELDALLANVVASFRDPGDWFANAAPDEPGTVRLRATFVVRRLGAEIGRERLVVVEKRDGSLVATSDRDERSPTRRRVTARAELDASRALRSLHVAIDGFDRSFGSAPLADVDVLAAWVALAPRLVATDPGRIETLKATRIELDGTRSDETIDVYHPFVAGAGFTIHRGGREIRGAVDVDAHGSVSDVVWSLPDADLEEMALPGD
jgi:imidazolonepropionase-like amidohydrolase